MGCSVCREQFLFLVDATGWTVGGGGGGWKRAGGIEEADPEPGTWATNSLSLSSLATGQQRGKDIEGKTYYKAENGIVD